MRSRLCPFIVSFCWLALASGANASVIGFDLRVFSNAPESNYRNGVVLFELSNTSTDAAITRLMLDTGADCAMDGAGPCFDNASINQDGGTGADANPPGGIDLGDTNNDGIESAVHITSFASFAPNLTVRISGEFDNYEPGEYDLSLFNNGALPNLRATVTFDIGQTLTVTLSDISDPNFDRTVGQTVSAIASVPAAAMGPIALLSVLPMLRRRRNA